LYVVWSFHTVHESIHYGCMENASLPPLRDPPLTIAFEMPRKKKDDSSFGPRLTAIRKARGLTQIQLAEAAGTTQRSVSYYENDAGIPPASAVIALAKALEVSADELLGLRSPRVKHVDDDAGTRRLWKRFQMMTALPEKDQRAVIRLINSLVAVGGPRQGNGGMGDRNGHA
jgi:transcriptional regulator with XRE-family HTH domain